jgi:ankyrin repeat protein
MHLSAGDGHLETVKLLLERGADIHALNHEGHTPYQLSLPSGSGEIADLLYSGNMVRVDRGSTKSFYDLNALYSNWRFGFSLGEESIA